MEAVTRAKGDRRVRRSRAILLVSAGIVSLLGAATAPAQAQGPQPAATDPLPKWGPFIDLDGKLGTERNIGTGDLFVPLLQDGSSMLFTDLRGRFDDRDSREGNFGLGVRHMLASGWNLGAYGYYDRRKTALDSNFGQATFGTEALSLDWDLRANVYQPVGPSVRNISTSSSSTSSSTSTSTSSSTSSSSAALANTSVQVTTTTTTTTSTTTNTTTTTTLQTNQEVAQQGFDAEIGWRVPIFAAVDTTQLRVYAGGYRFSGNGVRATQGPRGRLDLTIDQAPYLWNGARLELGAEVQHDQPRGTQAFAMLRLRIPLQVFGAPPAALTAMERRMEDPVVRDVDVVTEPRTTSTTSSSSSTTSSTSTASSSLVETATQTAGGGAFTVINSSGTTGAALPGAVAAAGVNSTVLLSGTFNTGVADTVTVQAGQTLTGILTVETPSGRTATVSTGAKISGTNVNLATVVLGSGATLSGLTVSNAYSGGAGGIAVDVANTAGNVTVQNNTITVTQSGNNGAVALAAGFNNANLAVTGNTITAVGSGSATTMTAVSLQSNGTTATVSGNTLSASAGTTNIIANLTNAVINSGSTGNVRGGGACFGATFDGSKISFTNGTTCP